MDRETVTAVFAEAFESDEGDELFDRLVPLVYEELRGLARRELAKHRRGRTLDTTGLVHEAYLRLVDHDRVPRKGRAYFFAAAARAMRQVLVDSARARQRQKRGGGQRPVTLDEAFVGTVDDLVDDVLALEDALERLAADFPRQARVVECRYYGGLSVEETAEALDVSDRTVKRDWALARAWLYDAIRSAP